MENEKDLERDQVEEEEREEEEESYEELLAKERKKVVEKIRKITDGKVIVKFLTPKDFERASKAFGGGLRWPSKDEEYDNELTIERYREVMDVIDEMNLRLSGIKTKKKKKNTIESLLKS